MKAHQLQKALELEAKRQSLTRQLADVDAGRVMVKVGGTDTWSGVFVDDKVLGEAIAPDVRLVVSRQLARIEAELRELGVETS
jgi:hypothetical protein